MNDYFDFEDVNAIMELVPEDQKKLDVQRPDGPDGEAHLDMGMFLLAYANAVRVYIKQGTKKENDDESV
jgi:hypothetical protein